MDWKSVHLDKQAPNFVLFYKDECPQCNGMHQEWINLAKHVKENHQKLNVVAIGASDQDTVHRFNILKYPSVRLFKDLDNPTRSQEFKQAEDGHDLKEAKFLEFLQQNGVDMTKHEDEAPVVPAEKSPDDYDFYG